VLSIRPNVVQKKQSHVKLFCGKETFAVITYLYSLLEDVLRCDINLGDDKEHRDLRSEQICKMVLTHTHSNTRQQSMVADFVRKHVHECVCLLVMWPNHTVCMPCWAVRQDNHDIGDNHGTSI
jgi:hypothetical protein